MQGLEVAAGIDRCATLALLSKKDFAEVGLLRSILSGCVRLQKRLHDAKLVDSETDVVTHHCDTVLRAQETVSQLEIIHQLESHSVNSPALG